MRRPEVTPRMEISCYSCGTSHEIPDAMLVGRGRKVRCRNCRQVWLVEALPDPNGAPLPDGTAAATSDGDPTPMSGDPSTMSEPAGRRRRAKADKPPLPPGGRLSWLARPGAQGPGSRLPLVSLAAVGALALALVVFRAEVVSALPQSARLYAAAGLPVNLRGLDLARLKSRITDENGVSVLVIEGEVTNVAKAPVAPPPLRYAIRGADGVELYVWTARLDKPMLEPGETVAFRRRLAAPPPEGRDVLVTFAREDETASNGPATALKP